MRMSWIIISLIAAVVTHLPLSASEISEGRHQKRGNRIVQSLFRFPASRLGPEFEELINPWHHDWLHVPTVQKNDTLSSVNSSSLPTIFPDPSGFEHSTRAVTTDAATLFRRQCYTPAPLTSQQHYNLYNNLEQRRKSIEFEYMNDSKQEMMFLHTMIKRLYPAFLLDDDDGKNDHTAATQIHKKKSRSTANTVYASKLPHKNPVALSFQTFSTNSIAINETQQWTWRPAGLFSSRGTPGHIELRANFFNTMRSKLQDRLLEHKNEVQNFNGFEMGRLSGMFWYPPGAVREWHDNHLDLIGHINNGRVVSDAKKKDEEILASQVWRMYFVRVVRDENFDEKLASLRMSFADNERDPGNNNLTVDEWVDSSANDHSATHIIPGDDKTGVTLEVLKKAGARPLTKDEQLRRWEDIFAEGYPRKNGNNLSEDDGSFDRNNVWRIPDQDGYVTFFRLPDLWHCIVSEEVHRYSLGFAFSDAEVQALLKLAGEDYDVEEIGTESEEGENSHTAPHGKDEL
mmetsp:Transcript_8194/g.16303  ORF Transcript_8194/g.16303 Transcript_8194/m.16303 type:complete len:515 (-) Transcript_8194:57-1601(-)